MSDFDRRASGPWIVVNWGAGFGMVWCWLIGHHWRWGHRTLRARQCDLCGRREIRG